MIVIHLHDTVLSFNPSRFSLSPLRAPRVNPESLTLQSEQVYAKILCTQPRWCNGNQIARWAVKLIA